MRLIREIAKRTGPDFCAPPIITVKAHKGKPDAKIFIPLLVNLATLPLTNAQERILVSYGGHNETVGPLWVAADKGFFKKSGLDVSILQVRNGQVSLTALMSGDVHAFWTAVSSVLSG